MLYHCSESLSGRTNNLLGPNKNFPFPGDVAINFGAQQVTLNNVCFTCARFRVVILKMLQNHTEKIVKPEPQGDTSVKTLSIEQLLNLNSNIKKAADYEPTPFIDKLKSDCNVELKAVDCPRLLKKGIYFYLILFLYSSSFFFRS